MNSLEFTESVIDNIMGFGLMICAFLLLVFALIGMYSVFTKPKVVHAKQLKD